MFEVRLFAKEVKMKSLTNLTNLVVVSVFLLGLSGSVFATGSYNGGDGLTAATAFQINTPAQMDEIGRHSEDWDSYFILTGVVEYGLYMLLSLY